MHKAVFRLLSTTLLGSSLVFAPFSYAEQEENFEVTQKTVTKDELAAIYVFSETCSALKEHDAAFSSGYQKLLKDYLPNEKAPVSKLQNLVKQADYRSALSQARKDAKNAGENANREICEDIRNYHTA